MLVGSVFKSPYPFMFLSVCVHWQEWDLFGRLWTFVVFSFPVIWSRVFPRQMTARCPLDVLCLGEHFTVLRTMVLAGMPFQCNPPFSTLCSPSSCKFICALISEILFWTTVSVPASRTVNMALHSVLWVPHHFLNLVSCPKVALNWSFNPKLHDMIFVFLCTAWSRDWCSFCSFLIEHSKKGNSHTRTSYAHSLKVEHYNHSFLYITRTSFFSRHI